MLLCAAAAILLGAAEPTLAAASSPSAIVDLQEEQSDRSVAMTVEGSAVSVKGAAGKTLNVISITGKPVAVFKIDGPAWRVELNLPKGCYILKVGNVVRKISIR